MIVGIFFNDCADDCANACAEDRDYDCAEDDDIADDCLVELLTEGIKITNRNMSPTVVEDE